MKETTKANIEQTKWSLVLWSSKKPTFTEDCWLVTNHKTGYNIWQIKKIESDDGWYWGWLDSNGDEYGDIEDLDAEGYVVLPNKPE